MVLDNCSIHHVEGISSEVGPLAHFLPPYLPDSNPIEETFLKVKEESVYGMDIETIVFSASATITPDNCKGWIMNTTKLILKFTNVVQVHVTHDIVLSSNSTV